VKVVGNNNEIFINSSDSVTVMGSGNVFGSNGLAAAKVPGHFAASDSPKVFTLLAQFTQAMATFHADAAAFGPTTAPIAPPETNLHAAIAPALHH